MSNITRKIYLAGPEVFLSDATKIGDFKKSLCSLYGFEGLFPLDNVIKFSSAVPQENGLEIAFANEQLIAEADYIIANITPFRGASCDVGTAYEMGLARGYGKPVFAYTNDTMLFLERNLSTLPGCQSVGDNQYIDNLGMTLENFGLIDNLMLDGAVSDSIVMHDLVEKNQPYRELVGFEQCLKQVVKYEKEH
ncbi:nucleoside 2-deoxyribosyltransferase [Vibrio sp.]|uniref:nucleoside 2-deoxyribosyltransferase n=1 Tax=Vibrio sp. TaxID=678 RepID=UPI003D0A27CA